MTRCGVHDYSGASQRGQTWGRAQVRPFFRSEKTKPRAVIHPGSRQLMPQLVGFYVRWRGVCRGMGTATGHGLLADGSCITRG
jgi:hypothetical protein